MPAARCLHLPRQPLAAVEAYVHRERKPCFHAGVQPSQFGIDRIVIVMQALALPTPQLQFLCRAVAINLVGPAWLDTAEHAHQTLANPISLGDAARRILLAG